MFIHVGITHFQACEQRDEKEEEEGEMRKRKKQRHETHPTRPSRRRFFWRCSAGGGGSNRGGRPGCIWRLVGTRYCRGTSLIENHPPGALDIVLL